MRPLTLMVTLAVLLLTLPLLAAAEEADPWDWDLRPELGAGITYLEKAQFGLFLGLRFGHLPERVPLVGGRDFGLDLAYMEGGCVTTGLWLHLADVGKVPVRIGFLLWQDEPEKLKGDLALRVGIPFEITW